MVNGFIWSRLSRLVTRLGAKSSTLRRVVSIRRISLGITDQAIVGATGFATSVIIGRWGSKEELGSYFLILSILLFARGLQQSAVSMPYIVYWSRRVEERRDAYAGSCLGHQIILALLTSISFLCLAVAAMIGFAPRELVSPASVLIVFGPFLLLKEHLRQLAFAHMRMAAAIQLDTTVAFLQVVGLILLATAGLLSAASAYLIIGIACIVACIAWFAADHIRFRFIWGEIGEDWKWNWDFGKWAVAGQIIGSIVPTFIPWVLGYYHGLGETGLLGSALALVGVCNILVMGVDNVLAPRAVEALARGGRGSLWTVVRNTSVGLVLALAVFFLFSVFFGELISVALFGPKFGGAGTVMATLALALLINSLAITAATGLYVLERTKLNFVVDLIATLVAMSAAVLLVVPLGALGAAAASVVAAVVSATGKCLVLIRIIRNGSATAP